MGSSEVSLSNIQQKKAAIDAAVLHYESLANDLQTQDSELGATGALTGQHGKTGGYQERLGAFSDQWIIVFKQYIADERAFVEFLKGFSTRLESAHSLYSANEQEAVESLASIERMMDRMGWDSHGA